MSEKPESSGGGAEKRRSTRVLHSSSITVKGTDALGKEFRESAKTVMVNCYGCLYQSTRYPTPSSAIMIEVRHQGSRRPPRMVPGRVIWVQRPQNYRALYHVGIEFEVPGNVWDIAMPPEDWFPCPEDEELVIPSSGEENLSNPNQFVIRAPASDAEESRNLPAPQANPVNSPSRATETLFLSEDRETLARTASAEREEIDSPAIVDMVKMVTAEAIAEEIVRIRDFIDIELQDAIDKAVDRLIHRITNSAALNQLTEQAAAAQDELLSPSTSARERPLPAIAPDAQDPEAASLLNARQRRAAKRARKASKSEP